MNEQEIFDTVLDHLAKQKKRSVQGSSCVYRSQTGLKCAVGCLIPDELYVPTMENETVGTLLAEFPALPEWMRKHRGLLTALQTTHDRHDSWGSPEAMRAGLQEVAWRYNLDGSKIDLTVAAIFGDEKEKAV